MADNFFGITDVGKQRQNNEDTFIAQQGSNNRYIIACVIDGVGGYSGGEIAAEIARETILQRVDKISGEVIPALVDTFHIANDKIWQEKQAVKEHGNMACVLTLAIVDIETNQFYYAHVGDTRLYLLRDGSLVKISHDQSFVGFLEDSGRLNEKEAMMHPKRNEIDKALGFKTVFSNSSDDVETGQSPFLPGDMLLLCSDGLTDVIDKAEITRILTDSASLKTIGHRLIDAANQGGGKDNITVVLVKNDKAQKQHLATKPAENTQAQKPEIAAVENTDKVSAHQPVKTNRIFPALLIIVVIALAAICIAQYIGYKDKETPEQKVAVSPVKKKRNPQEIKLQYAVDQNKGNLLLLSDTSFKSPVIISQAITINRDSLHIKAKGNITFQSDSGYSGPAFVLTSKTKKIILDSLFFQNFNIAISGFNQALTLKNVRFMNCKVPLQNMFDLANNKYISGSLATLLFTTDSLPKIK
ncbi:MAG: family protein phosphatase [Mucilaginibacter sp.]|nr:family protein phosphatase [Mucilaginibacter sp.]